MAMLNSEKMVSPVPITPICSTVKWPSVAMVSGIEPASPPCQTTKPE